MKTRAFILRGTRIEYSTIALSAIRPHCRITRRANTVHFGPSNNKGLAHAPGL
jgi:hypothetical protein